MTNLICIICKGDIEKHYSADGIMYWNEGHSAEPIADGRCCDKCNDDIVLGHRVAEMMLGKGGKNDKSTK